MVYEIEKRAKFEYKEEFEKIKKRVEEMGGVQTEKYFYKSFLFRKPEYLRIRVVRGKDFAEITFKTGTPKDTVRQEINQRVNLGPDLDNEIEKLKSKGYTECACIITENVDYELDGLTISFNTMNELGSIIEVEALTADESEIEHLENKVKELMEKLNLKELPPSEYQTMMDSMYSNLLKPVDEQEFPI